MHSYDYAHREGELPLTWDDFAALSRRLAEELAALGVAAAAGEPHEGRLAPGCRADFVVLEADPFSVPPEELGRVRPTATYVDGRLALS